MIVCAIRGSRDEEIDRTTTKRFSILYKGFEILQKQLENKTGLCFDKGVCISHRPEIERIFEVSINVHSLQEDGQADVIYLLRLNYSDIVETREVMYEALGKEYKEAFNTYQKYLKVDISDFVLRK